MTRHRRGPASPIILVLALVFATSGSAGATELPPGFQETLLVSGLAAPTAMAWAPDGELWIIGQRGHIWVLRSGSLIQLASLPVAADGERGLGGIALDPDYASNRYVWLYYTTAAPPIHNRLSRFTRVGDQLVDETVVLEGPTLVNSVHNGGCLRFAADKTLFVSMGDDDQGVRRRRTRTTCAARSCTSIATGPRSPTTRLRTARAAIHGCGRTASGTHGASTCSRSRRHCSSATWEPPRSRSWTSGSGAGTSAGAGSRARSPRANRGTCIRSTRTRTIRYWAARSSRATTRSRATSRPPTWATISSPTSRPAASSEWSSMPRTCRSPPRSSPRRSSAPWTCASDPTARSTTSPSTAASCAASRMRAEPTASRSPSPRRCRTLDHTYAAGSYTVSLRVEDGRGGAATAAALRVVSGNAPPMVTITSPSMPRTYRVGELIYFSGTATDPEEGTLPCSRFTWRVVLHHREHTHPFLGPLQGMCGGSFVAVRHELPNFYEVQLSVEDSGVPLGPQGTLTGTRSVAIPPAALGR